MKVRISTEARRSEDSSYNRSPCNDYTYSAAAASSTSSPRVIIDCDGIAHDPDYMASILSEHKELVRRRALSNKKARRLSQVRVHSNPQFSLEFWWRRTVQFSLTVFPPFYSFPTTLEGPNVQLRLGRRGR